MISHSEPEGKKIQFINTQTQVGGKTTHTCTQSIYVFLTANTFGSLHDWCLNAQMGSILITSTSQFGLAGQTDTCPQNVFTARAAGKQQAVKLLNCLPMFLINFFCHKPSITSTKPGPTTDRTSQVCESEAVSLKKAWRSTAVVWSTGPDESHTLLIPEV